mgnify:CR=1 FL=1
MFIKGMTYGWDGIRGDYRTKEAVQSLKKLKETGAEWIALAFFTFQDTIHSTNIYFDYGRTVTDRDIAFAVKTAKELGLKVCLKPVVNSKDRIWRARIGFPDEGTGYWKKWFASYTNFILHYAELAEELECEMFCIGCEMIGTEKRESEWRELIKRVRKIYSGPIVYNANHSKERDINWLDDVDIIGTSAYYRVAEKPGDSVETMIKNWQQVKDHLYQVHQKFQKPILFAEIGCRSARGCAMMPWDFTHTDLPFDEEEQANFYQSALEVFWDEPWFIGFFWWDWSTKLYSLETAKTNRGFDIYGKKAEQILKDWYKNKKEIG